MDRWPGALAGDGHVFTTPCADVAFGSAPVRPTRRPEADPEVTAYLDVELPYPEVDYHGRHTATGAYPQVPATRQAYP